MRPATQGSCKVFKKDEIRWWDELWADLNNWNEHVRACEMKVCACVWVGGGEAEDAKRGARVEGEHLHALDWRWASHKQMKERLF